MEILLRILAILGIVTLGLPILAWAAIMFLAGATFIVEHVKQARKKD